MLVYDRPGVLRRRHHESFGSPKTSPHSAKPRLEVRIIAALFVSGIDELEEQIATTWDDRQVADLVDDQERGAG